MNISSIQEFCIYLFKKKKKKNGQLLDISPKYFIFLKTFNSEFSYIEVLFTDQNYKLPEIQDKVNITLKITIKMSHNSIEPREKVMDFCLLLKIYT